MEILYLDSSALIKLYVWERSSERMMELASEDADRSLAVCAVTQVEFRSAIDRRRRERDLGKMRLSWRSRYSISTSEARYSAVRAMTKHWILRASLFRDTHCGHTTPFSSPPAWFF